MTLASPSPVYTPLASRPAGVDLFGWFPLRRDAELRDGMRLRLSRDWAEGRRAFVLAFNPSSADAQKDDPTTAWLIAWFRRFGYGGFDLGNLYPFSVRKPLACRQLVTRASAAADAAFHDAMCANLEAVVAMAGAVETVFVAYGGLAWDLRWADAVVGEIQLRVTPRPDLWCWGTTRLGAPLHPLARGSSRIPRDRPAVLWRAANVSARASGRLADLCIVDVARSPSTRNPVFS